jgi:phosphoribosylamine--glycine ligase
MVAIPPAKPLCAAAGSRRYQSLMRILGVSETCDLGSMYLRLIAEGHEVRVAVSEPLAAGTMAGMVPRTKEWRAELAWVKEAGEEGLILFEAVGFGQLQDELRRDGYNVIGGSAFGDRLEEERTFAQKLLAELGMRVASATEFTSLQAALSNLADRPRRCVFKRCASAADTFVGMMSDGRDIAAFLRSVRVEGETFMLMDHLEGIETGVGAYFNGEHFLRPACIDWEHKRFFAGDLGELTGEMGTIATFDGSAALFEATLAPLEPLLRDARHVGWVNLNTIINEEGVWPLEFTCRFGYPGFAVLEPLQALGWGELLRQMVRRTSAAFSTTSGFSACIVLSTPPFPYSRKALNVPIGLPVIVDEVEPEHLHWGEVGKDSGGIVTSGLYGWTAVVTGIGRTIHDAQAAAYERARRIHTPDLRYRLDIGDKLAFGDLRRLAQWGWFPMEGVDHR